MARLNRHVLVHQDGGEPHVFGPDDELPDWAVAAIENDKVWDVAPESSDGEDDDDRPPAKSAPKSEWAQYAADHGFEVDDDATKNDIIAAVTGA